MVKQFYLKKMNIPTTMASPSQLLKPIRRLSCLMTCKIKKSEQDNETLSLTAVTILPVLIAS